MGGWTGRRASVFFSNTHATPRRGAPGGRRRLWKRLFKGSTPYRACPSIACSAEVRGIDRLLRCYEQCFELSEPCNVPLVLGDRRSHTPAACAPVPSRQRRRAYTSRGDGSPHRRTRAREPCRQTALRAAPRRRHPSRSRAVPCRRLPPARYAGRRHARHGADVVRPRSARVQVARDLRRQSQTGVHRHHRGVDGLLQLSHQRHPPQQLSPRGRPVVLGLRGDQRCAALDVAARACVPAAHALGGPRAHGENPHPQRAQHARRRCPATG